MNKLVGYLINGASGPGQAYTYFMAGNGVWIAAANEHLNITIPIADVNIRGLEPWENHIWLIHGKIPQRFWDLALSVFLASPEKERYVGIRYTGNDYQLYVPEQEGAAAGVKYQAAENVVLELHSHPDFGPGFSSIDDKDEQGLKIYGVVGELNEAEPAVNLRVGVYGYFHPISWRDVFDGNLSGVIDVLERGEEEEIQ